MSTVRLALTSNFPRSEELVAATREFDRGRRSAEELAALYDRWTSKVVDLERSLQFDSVGGGELSRQDLFRAFSEGTPGLEVGPLTRWFETNTFFRQPIVHGRPPWPAGAFARGLPWARLSAAKLPTRVILPGPYTFSGLADNRSGLTREELARGWSDLLAREVELLIPRGVRVVQVQEPLLVVSPPSVEEEGWVRRAFEPFASVLSRVESVLWTFFGDGAPVLPLLCELPFGTVGVDLTDTDPARLTDLPGGKGLGLGCLDSRTTLVEDAKEIARLVRDLQSRLHPASVLLGPGVPLELVPWSVAERKLRVLPVARQLVGGTAPARRPAPRAPTRSKPPPAARARKAPARRPAQAASRKRAPKSAARRRRSR